MSVSSADAIEHYQSQIPRLKSDFKKRRQALRRDFTDEQKLFTHHYVQALFELADEEVRKRAALACKSLTIAILAGWLPSDDELMRTYQGCFAPPDHSLNAFDDIGPIIDDAIGQLGRPPDLDLSGRFSRHISEVRVSSTNEHSAELRMQRRLASSEAGGMAHTNTFYAPVAAVQIGSGNANG